MTPLVSIQNTDPEKFQEVSERGLSSFSVLKKTESQTTSPPRWELIRVANMSDIYFIKEQESFIHNCTRYTRGIHSHRVVESTNSSPFT